MATTTTKTSSYMYFPFTEYGYPLWSPSTSIWGYNNSIPVLTPERGYTPLYCNIGATATFVDGLLSDNTTTLSMSVDTKMIYGKPYLYWGSGCTEMKNDLGLNDISFSLDDTTYRFICGIYFIDSNLTTVYALGWDGSSSDLTAIEEGYFLTGNLSSSTIGVTYLGAVSGNVFEEGYSGKGYTSVTASDIQKLITLYYFKPWSNGIGYTRYQSTDLVGYGVINNTYYLTDGGYTKYDFSYNGTVAVTPYHGSATHTFSYKAGRGGKSDYVKLIAPMSIFSDATSSTAASSINGRYVTSDYRYLIYIADSTYYTGPNDGNTYGSIYIYDATIPGTTPYYGTVSHDAISGKAIFSWNTAVPVGVPYGGGVSSSYVSYDAVTSGLSSFSGNTYITAGTYFLDDNRYVMVIGLATDNVGGTFYYNTVTLYDITNSDTKYTGYIGNLSSSTSTYAYIKWNSVPPEAYPFGGSSIVRTTLATIQAKLSTGTIGTTQLNGNYYYPNSELGVSISGNTVKVTNLTGTKTLSGSIYYVVSKYAWLKFSTSLNSYTPLGYTIMEVKYSDFANCFSTTLGGTSGDGSTATETDTVSSVSTTVTISESDEDVSTSSMTSDILEEIKETIESKIDLTIKKDTAIRDKTTTDGYSWTPTTAEYNKMLPLYQALREKKRMDTVRKQVASISNFLTLPRNYATIFGITFDRNTTLSAATVDSINSTKYVPYATVKNILTAVDKKYTTANTDKPIYDYVTTLMSGAIGPSIQEALNNAMATEYDRFTDYGNTAVSAKSITEALEDFNTAAKDISLNDTVTKETKLSDLVTMTTTATNNNDMSITLDVTYDVSSNVNTTVDDNNETGVIATQNDEDEVATVSTVSDTGDAESDDTTAEAESDAE